MERRACCITGHRDIPAQQIGYVKDALHHEIDKAIVDGYTYFMSGFGEGVEQLFAEIVIHKKEYNPILQLIAVLPYRKRLETLQKKERTKLLLERCADVIVIREEYIPCVYSHRNRYMVENSDRVIAVYDGREQGGTVNAIRFTHELRKELREIPVGRTIILPNN